MSRATLEEERKSDGKGFCESFPRPKEIYDLSFWNTSDEMVKKAHDIWSATYEQVGQWYIFFYICVFYLQSLEQELSDTDAFKCFHGASKPGY